LNLGGGHHLTSTDYEIEPLVALIRSFQQKYGLEVYLEPGQAVVFDAGILVTEVLDIVRNEVDIAIMDASATCHTPAVLEMPYRPDIHDGFAPGIKPHTYQFAGPSCLAGDLFGQWSFDNRLARGDRLAFLDMAHYTMVRNSAFNGIA